MSEAKASNSLTNSHAVKFELFSLFCLTHHRRFAQQLPARIQLPVTDEAGHFASYKRNTCPKPLGYAF